MLCAVIRSYRLDLVHRANELADRIEFHLGLMENPTLEQIHRLRRACRKPVIFTGGDAILPYLSCQPDYVDLPHTSPPELFERLKGFKRICSYHNYEDTPETFDTLFDRPAEIYKIATWAHSTTDALRLLAFLKKQKRPLIALSMGEYGTVTRILAPVFGSLWTYAPLEASQRTAPGQLLLEELLALYHYRALNPKTALYGLIGDPVTASPSHRTHNFAFHQLGLDAVYVKMRVTREELPTFLPLARTLGFRGLSVTMPLKEAVLPFAINTLSFKEGVIKGFNTDGQGALDALEERTKVEGKQVVILGAGGVAQGIAREAIRRNARVTLLGRTLSRVESVAKRLGCVSGSLESFKEVARSGYDILINGTPTLPIDPDHLLEKRLVLESVHGDTPFLQAAREKECTVIEGGELFVKQAALQFTRWLNCDG